jgi:hypothetical protein
MKSINHLTFGVLILLVFSACETTEKIDEFPLRPSKLVVNCYFSPDSIWEFQVSHSLSVLDNANLRMVDDAKIYIYEDEILLDSIVEQDSDRWYRKKNDLPLIGNSYFIEVKALNFETIVVAEDIAPEKVNVKNVEVIIIDSSFHSSQSYNWGYVDEFGYVEGVFKISFDDPVDEENYYKLSIFTYDTTYDHMDSTLVNIRKIFVRFSTQDAGSGTNETKVKSILFSDEVFNGQTYEISAGFLDRGVRRNSKYFVELVSLTWH